MGFLTGSTRSWRPELTADTTNPSYWLNWRVAMCGLWILITMIVSSFLISRYEGPRPGRSVRSRGRVVSHRRGQIEEEEEEEEKEEPGIVYEDEVWKTCIRGMHPGWLLAYRVLAFFVLLILLILNVAVDGGAIMYYYTQWTFTLVTIYFGLGSLLSMHGCYKYHNKVDGHDTGDGWRDTEHGNNLATANGELKGSNFQENLDDRNHHSGRVAGFWGYVFQIIFQMNAGAVMLTDCVFWLILVPFLATKNYDINFLIINMHTINAVFLLGDTAMNCLRFPWFRIAYFFLWTCFYVVFQWVIHACLYLWWPYPFLDLSKSLSPLWYSTVAIMHIPCFGIYILVIKMKHSILSRYFPQSYQCPR